MLLRNSPFMEEVRLTGLTRLRERAIRSYNLVNTVSRASPTKGKYLNNTSPPTC